MFSLADHNTIALAYANAVSKENEGYILGDNGAVLQRSKHGSSDRFDHNIDSEDYNSDDESSNSSGSLSSGEDLDVRYNRLLGDVSSDSSFASEDLAGKQHRPIVAQCDNFVCGYNLEALGGVYNEGCSAVAIHVDGTSTGIYPHIQSEISSRDATSTIPSLYSSFCTMIKQNEASMFVPHSPDAIKKDHLLLRDSVKFGERSPKLDSDELIVASSVNISTPDKRKQAMSKPLLTPPSQSPKKTPLSADGDLFYAPNAVRIVEGKDGEEMSTTEKKRFKSRGLLDYDPMIDEDDDSSTTLSNDPKMVVPSGKTREASSSTVAQNIKLETIPENSNSSSSEDTDEINTSKKKKFAVCASHGIKLRKGEVAVLVGSIGSGKSTLLSCLSGAKLPIDGRVMKNAEYDEKAKFKSESAVQKSRSMLSTGSLEIGSSVSILPTLREETESEDKNKNISLNKFKIVHDRKAYVAQKPFLLNSTIRENILFFEEFDDDRYGEVLDICCLLPDLAMFPDGDATLVGEAGVQLSGGQKARVGLARAIYSRAAVLFLDDVLSAVDGHTGRRLFERVILMERWIDLSARVAKTQKRMKSEMESVKKDRRFENNAHNAHNLIIEKSDSIKRSKSPNEIKAMQSHLLANLTRDDLGPLHANSDFHTLTSDMQFAMSMRRIYPKLANSCGGRSIFFVTHQLQFLRSEKVDRVYVIDEPKGGRAIYLENSVGPNFSSREEVWRSFMPNAQTGKNLFELDDVTESSLSDSHAIVAARDAWKRGERAYAIKCNVVLKTSWCELQKRGVPDYLKEDEESDEDNENVDDRYYDSDVNNDNFASSAILMTPSKSSKTRLGALLTIDSPRLVDKDLLREAEMDGNYRIGEKEPTIVKPELIYEGSTPKHSPLNSPIMSRRTSDTNQQLREAVDFTSVKTFSKTSNYSKKSADSRNSSENVDKPIKKTKSVESQRSKDRRDFSKVSNKDNDGTKEKTNKNADYLARVNKKVLEQNAASHNVFLAEATSAVERTLRTFNGQTVSQTLIGQVNEVLLGSEEETRFSDGISGHDFWVYLNLFGSRKTNFLLFLLLILSAAGSVAGNVWLSWWADNSGKKTSQLLTRSSSNSDSTNGFFNPATFVASFATSWSSSTDASLVFLTQARNYDVQEISSERRSLEGSETLNDDSDYRRNMNYLLVYVGINVFFAFVSALQVIILTVCSLKASTKLHQKMLDRLLAANMSFFDKTPTGRLINRFLQDLQSVDNFVPSVIIDQISKTLNLLTQIALIVIYCPLVLLLFPLIVMPYFYIFAIIRPPARNTRRIESVAHSPVY